MALDINSLKFGKPVSEEEYVSGKEIMAKADAITATKKTKSVIDGYNSFATAVETETSGENIFNASDFFEERKKQAEELKQRAASLAEYMSTHQDVYTQEAYDELMGILATFDTNVDDVMSRYQPSLDSKAGMAAYEDEYIAAMERNEQLRQIPQAAMFVVEPIYQNMGIFDGLFQQSTDNSRQAVTDDWTAEQRYNLGLYQNEDPAKARKYAELVNAGQDPFVIAKQQEAEKASMMAIDLDSEKREIDRMKADLENYSWNTEFDATSSSERKAFNEEIKRREKEITEREKIYNQAKRLQDSVKFASVTENEDFAVNSGYSSGVDTSIFDQPYGFEDLGQDALTYEYINNPDNVRSKINQNDTSFSAKGYDQLTEEEVGIYNYYYATEGPEKAQQYLDNIQETLNYRMGERIAQSKSGDLWKQYLSADITGYGGAVSGLQNLFNDDEYIPATAFQQASGMIREDLADVGKMPEFYGDTSLGQIGYDLISTTANMVPSIAASSLFGPVAGAATMGASSAGNAYQEALNSGYSKEKARTYAALIGASEAGLDYVLGGISKLGGEIPQQIIKNMVRGVDNAVARAAINLGGSMASEGFEEGLQEVITPWLENLILYADKDVNWDEVAYSTLLGALSGGFMEGPGVVVNTANVSSVEKQLKSLGSKGNTLELAELIVKQKSGEKLSQDEYIKLVKNEPAMKILKGQTVKTEDTGETVSESAPVEKPKVSKDGRAIQISTNEAVDTLDFASVNKGKATIQLKSGETAEYSDVSFASEAQANQFYAVASLPGIDTENANDLLHTIQDADAGKDVDSVVGIREAYGIGYFGMQESDLESGDAAKLSPELRKAVFDIGRQQRSADAMVKATTKPVTAKPSAGYKKVVFEGKTRQITKKQKSEIDFVDYIAENFSGNTVHVFESYKGRDGKYYYRDNNGKVHRAPNGMYVNGEIWLDLKSGDNQEGLMLNTFAHEMYHHIEKFDKAKAQELAEFVVKELGKKSVDDAVAEQIKKARKARLGESYFQSRGMTAEQARNEVYMRAMSDFVADSLETMFTRGDPYKAIANLKKENRTLFDEIKAFIDKWVSKLKEFYSDKTISEEGAKVAQLEKFEQLQQLFMEGVQSAGDNYRKTQTTINNREKQTQEEKKAQPLKEPEKKAQPLKEPEKKAQPLKEPEKKTQPLKEPEKKTQPLKEPEKKTQPLKEPEKKTQPLKEPEKKTRNEPQRIKEPVMARDTTHAVKKVYFQEAIISPNTAFFSPDVKPKESNIPFTLYSDNTVGLDIDNSKYKEGFATIESVYNTFSGYYEFAIDGKKVSVGNILKDGKYYTFDDTKRPVVREISGGNYVLAEKGVLNFYSDFREVKTRAVKTQETSVDYTTSQKDIVPGESGEVFNAEGDPVAMSTEDGSVMFSIRTYEEADRDLEAYSLRNEKPKQLTNRDILTQMDASTRKKTEAHFLGQYQENLSKLTELEPRLAELNDKIAELSKDSKKNTKELISTQSEQRSVKEDVNRLKGLVRSFERSPLGKQLVIEARAKAQKEKSRETMNTYKKEQKKLIEAMQTEQRVLREELTGTRSVMSIMEDEFVRLAKDLEAKKIDLKTMEEKFLLVSKQYDKDTQKWLREYRKLMSQYRKLDARNDRNLSKIEQLEEIIQRQRKTAKAKVTSRRNTEMRHKIQRKANELNQLLLHGTKHRNIPEGMQPAVASILKAINMEVRDGEKRRATYEATLARYDRQIAMTSNPVEVSRLIEKRNEYAAKGDQFANKMAELKAAYEEIQDNKIPNLEIDEGLSSRLMELFVIVGDTPLGHMTAEQLEAVNDVLEITKATVRNANQMLAEARSAGVVESSKAAIMEIKRAGETKKKKTPLRKKLEQFGWNNLKPVYAFDVIGSKTLTARYEALRKGEDTLAVDLKEAKEFFQDQWKKNGGKDWNMDQKWKFTSTSGKSFELDLNQIMSLYALAKDKDARSHLRVGGFAFDSDYQTKKDINLGPVKIPVKVESTDASAYNLSDEILGEIISKLTPQQRAFADAMQAYLSDTMAAKGNEVSLKKYGIRLFKNKDYFPIPVADQFMAKAREQKSGDREIKNSGFTKNRKPEAKNPVVLSGFTEIWAEHVDEMSLYHSFVLPLDDFNRVLNYHDAFVEGEQASSVVEAITNAFGKGAVNYIDQLIKDVNGGIKGGSTVSFANRMVSKAKKAQTMASLSVAIQQPSSILRSMSEVDLKYFLGPKVTEKTHDRTWNEIKEHAPIAIIKEMGGYDTNVGKSTVDYLTDTAEYNGFGEKFKALFTDEKFRDDALGRLPALMDEMSWGVIWNAVKREQADQHPNMDVKSDAFMKLVANRFTEVITRTQVYDSVFSRSGLMRDRKSDLAKMTTSFMAEPTTTANMLAVSILQAKRGDIPKKQAVKTTASIVASLALNAALVSIVYAMRDDDEDKRYDEKWIENFYSNFFESLNPLGYIPYVRDIYNLFVKGYDVERADMELFGDLQNAFDGLDNDDLTAWEKTENVIGAIGNLVGIPLKNILRDGRGIAKTVAIALDEESKDRSTKTGKYMARRGMDLSDGEEMILALQREDEEHIQRVFGRYESQQEAERVLQSAIREQYKNGDLTREEAEKLLRENFDRDDENEVYWILDEWDYAKENGSSDGYAKYGNLYEAIENGGDYAAEMDRLMEHGSEESEIRSQITKKYHKKYLEGDEDTQKDIREKIIPVLEAAGLDEAEIEEKFNSWDFEVEYGMTYSEMKAEYRNGDVTENEMRNAMKFYGLKNFEVEETMRSLNDEIAFVNQYDMTLSEMKESYDDGNVTRNQMKNALVFSGMTQTEAQKWITQRDIENRYGIDYAKLDDAYKHNDISRTDLYNAMIENGATKQEADDAILGYDWLKKNVKKYPDMAISDAKKFAVRISTNAPDYTLEDFGVNVDDYVQYSKLRPDCKGVDNNGDGQADSGTKRDAIFKMIDSLPISSDAKDGLALIDYGMKSILKNAPWH